MATLMENLKLIFFLMSVVIGIFFLRGRYIILQADKLSLISKILMPGYLLLVGSIIGYIIAQIILLKYENVDKTLENKILIKYFLVGLGIGVCLALVYIFLAK